MVPEITEWKVAPVMAGVMSAASVCVSTQASLAAFALGLVTLLVLEARRNSLARL